MRPEGAGATGVDAAGAAPAAAPAVNTLTLAPQELDRLLNQRDQQLQEQRRASGGRPGRFAGLRAMGVQEGTPGAEELADWYDDGGH